MFFTTYTYEQIKWSPDARNTSYEGLGGRQVTYTVVTTKTRQDYETNRRQTVDKQK